jgi:hypothetical protein
VEGDGGLALYADVNQPTSVAVSQDGTVYIGQSSRVRKVGTDGIISSFDYFVMEPSDATVLPDGRVMVRALPSLYVIARQKMC